MTAHEEKDQVTGLEIAVIGMAGRFPGARNIEDFWENLKKGVESICFFSDRELLEAGTAPGYLKNPFHVKAKGVLGDTERFDANFFDYPPVEAEIMHPQTRIFHECVWEALEDSGYNPHSYEGLIGLYVGATSSFAWESLSFLSGKNSELGDLLSGYLTNKDHISLRISFRLNLRGPVISLFTTCSTSLVAIDQACRSLLSGQCDMTLAGGVTVTLPSKSGYIYQEGTAVSPEGHCRPFAAEAKGTIAGDGAGVVLLKPLEDARQDRDHIYAVIKGTATNNDGLQRAGYTAPGVRGQADVIIAAHHMAEIQPESIGYIETHGTGTILGDPIEVEALTQAFNTGQKGFCALGSVKGNVGHLDCAAGAAGFIKAVLVLHHKMIPPTLHSENPNSKIDFKNGPFYVNTTLVQWKSRGYPLRAGISAFGIGGTNAHVVLEEWRMAQSAERKAHSREPGEYGAISQGQGRGGVSPPDRSWDHQLILLSAKTETALDQMTRNLANHFKKNPGIPLADAAYTLQVGRKALEYRNALVCPVIDEAVAALNTADSRQVHTHFTDNKKKPVFFLFPAVGSQYQNMGLELYKQVTLFRQEMDRCFEILKSHNCDIKSILYPHADRDGQETKLQVNQPEIAHILLFIVEYSLAQLLMKWGIKPGGMLGYSIGEYVAACISGVFSLKDALKLILSRGRLLKEIPVGEMLSVPLAKQDIKSFLTSGLSIAVDNGPSCIVSGLAGEIDAFEKKMKKQRVLVMRLQASVAGHSSIMEPILKKFVGEFRDVTLNDPQIPYISNVTGSWSNAEEVKDPGYWARHLGETVRFADGVKELVKNPRALFMEVGPGHDLSALLMRFIDIKSGHKAINMMRPPEKKVSDVYYLLRRLGDLWLYGVEIDWAGFYDQEKRNRVSLPTYPFAGQRYRLEGSLLALGSSKLVEKFALVRKPDTADWFYVPSWKRTPLAVSSHNPREPLSQHNWLVFTDQCGLGSQMSEQLEKNQQQVARVNPGPGFAKKNSHEYTINPGEFKDYERLFHDLQQEKNIPDRIIHLWGVSFDQKKEPGDRDPDRFLEAGFYSLLNITQVMDHFNINHEMSLMAVTNNMQQVMGEDYMHPHKAVVTGPVRVIPSEYHHIRCCSLDIILNQQRFHDKKIIVHLLAEFERGLPEPVLAYRDKHRWVQVFEPVRLDVSKHQEPGLRERGVYLITGGLGGVGFALAQYLAKTVHARLVLTGKSLLPRREKWKQILASPNTNDHICQKIKKVQELENHHAEVLFFCADVTHLEQMQEVIRQTGKKFGPVNGVIHAAGVPDGPLIRGRTRETCEPVLAPKIKGTRVLEKILKNSELDFFVLCSSIHSILGSPGHVSYCSADAFLDAFANSKALSSHQNLTAINWPRWKNTGIGKIDETVHKKLTGKDLEGGMTQAEGQEVFSRILGTSLSQVILSAYNLQMFREHVKEVYQRPSHESIFEGNHINEKDVAPPQFLLTDQYVASRDELEERLAEIWQKLLGVKQVGIHDDFFELGGDSLKAGIAVAKIAKEFSVNIPLVEMLKRSTIRQLAGYIRSAAGKSKPVKYDNLVLLKSGANNEGRLFLVHDGTGQVDGYLEFCQHLKPGYECWGIKSHRFENPAPQNLYIEDIARKYVENIQTLQPQGPYTLVGWSLGGIIAFEMTKQLEEMKEKIEFLIMIDATAPEPGAGKVEKEFGVESEVSLIREYFPGFPGNETKKEPGNVTEVNRLWADLVNYLESKNIKEETIKKMTPGHVAKTIPGYDGLSRDQLIDYLNIYRSFIKSQQRYVPGRRINTRIHYFAASESKRVIKNDWSQYTHQPVNFYEIKGNHFSILEMPGVRALVKEIAALMDRSGPAG